MLVLDTNHIRALAVPGVAGQRLFQRLQRDRRAFATTIVTVHEVLSGWFAELNRIRGDAGGWVQPYGDLQRAIRVMCDWDVLPFDTGSADQFEILQHNQRARQVGAMDKRIAAITLSHNGVLLTQNARHFERIPNLVIEDWISDAPPNGEPSLP